MNSDDARPNAGTSRRERAVYYGAVTLAIAFGGFWTHTVVSGGLPPLLIAFVALCGAGMAWSSAMGASVGGGRGFSVGFGFGVGLLMSPLVYIPIRMTYQLLPILVEVTARAW